MGVAEKICSVISGEAIKECSFLINLCKQDIVEVGCILCRAEIKESDIKRLRELTAHAREKSSSLQVQSVSPLVKRVERLWQKKAIMLSYLMEE